MKHFILFVVLSLALYFGWKFAPAEIKAAIKTALKRYAGPVAVIIGAALLFLVGAFFSTSFKLL